VVVIGGGMVGSETAELLADQGKQVTVVEMLDDLAVDVGALTRALLLNRIEEKKIKVLTKSKVQGITADGVIIENEEGSQEISGVDTVVVAVGYKSRNNLSEIIKGEDIPVYTIGDCVKPRKILEAVQEGFSLAYSL
jgi:pyruvate/2-oxoglutarate dehydrogenase complex dihydrolipoamide dehydrogenase (E3) component